MVGEIYRLEQGEDERERAGNPTDEELDKALARYYIEEARIKRPGLKGRDLELALVSPLVDYKVLKDGPHSPTPVA
jgi:hypothetical protein